MNTLIAGGTLFTLALYTLSNMKLSEVKIQQMTYTLSAEGPLRTSCGRTQLVCPEEHTLVLP